MFQEGDKLLVYLRERRSKLWPRRRVRHIAEASVTYLSVQPELRTMFEGWSGDKDIVISVNVEPMIKIIFTPAVSEYESINGFTSNYS